ncbi:MAG: polyprenyl synthetase family protein [Phycisphaerae bacterium]
MKADVTKINIGALLSELAGKVDQSIREYCDRFLSGPPQLVQAMRYSLEAGGKRIRPVLVLLSSDLYGGQMETAMFPAAAIEMVHTFSLIHDDLPAMDNDDFRRGRPTCHKAFGEAMAILAGDGLLAFAFELIAKHFPGPADQAAALVKELAEATGPAGMTGGQVLDMTFDRQDGLATVEEIHRLKTAALIRCACRLGAISAGATNLDSVSDYGQKIGLAFQLIDDYLDQTSTQTELGKKTGKDADANKPNYAVLSGTAAARQRAEELIEQAREALKSFGPTARPLIELAQMVLTRKS